jgi:PAS domain S-box-containing protein
MNKRRFFYSFVIILLLIVVVAGWFATGYLGNKARQEIIGESQSSALTLSIYVSSTFTNIKGAVKSLAGSPWIAPALLSKGERDIEHANSALDRYNSALSASVSYLMDADGMTVASSNRKDPDSFVGISYRFRPYFQEAFRGNPDRYFALGITSGKRGFYASHPVQNRLGKVLGVVTMKKDLDEMETFFSKYSSCSLISPDGIIFLSSTPSMVLKSLWPLDKTAQEKLIASQQFGNKPFEAVIEKAIADGADVTLEGKEYFVSRKVIDSDGWSIVLLAPTDRIKLYKLIGIIATIFVCFLIVFFSGIIYVTARSKEAIRQSEESKRLLLHAVGDGIFGIDATEQVTFVNPAALRMVGFSEEEMLGQSAHLLIHHSHKDGSNYPVEDCPMHTSYTKATENRVTEEVLWRKDGSSFPVEYSSTPIIRDSSVIGVVVVFKDITERKQAEEARYQYEKLQGVLEMAGAICHEMNQPMQIISGCSEMLLMNISENDPIHTKLDTIITQIHRMGTITRKLMTIKDYETQDYAGFSRIIDIDKSAGKDTE